MYCIPYCACIQRRLVLPFALLVFYGSGATAQGLNTHQAQTMSLLQTGRVYPVNFIPPGDIGLARM